MSIRFAESGARAMGRSAVGVWGIRLAEGDAVCSMLVTDGTGTLLTICENGYGKRTVVEEYRIQSRGGKGIIDIRANERNGKVVKTLAVADDDEVMMITKDGQIVRTNVSGISVIGRNTQGVRCISLNGDDKLVSVARIPKEEPEEEAEAEGEIVPTPKAGPDGSPAGPTGPSPDVDPEADPENDPESDPESPEATPESEE